MSRLALLKNFGLKIDFIKLTHKHVRGGRVKSLISGDQSHLECFENAMARCYVQDFLALQKWCVLTKLPALAQTLGLPQVTLGLAKKGPLFSVQHLQRTQSALTKLHSLLMRYN